MLTASQCAIVAYLDECEFICPDCARERYGAVTVDKADEGVENASNLRPIIQYELDEENGKRVYEAARERVADFGHDHPKLADILGVQLYRPTFATDVVERNTLRLVNRLAEKLADTYSERCAGCDEVLG